MKPADKIKKLIKNANLKVSPDADSRILADALAEMKLLKSAKHKPNIWRIIMKSKIAKIATAAAIILVAVFVIFFANNNTERIDNQISYSQKTPAVSTSLLSLNAAFKHGGLEEVEQLCEKAFEVSGPLSNGIDLLDVFKESNGS
jgi:hypothetical protein